MPDKHDNTDDDLIPLQPLDEQEEQRQRDLEEQIRSSSREYLAEIRGDPPIPLEHREDLSAADVGHFVVNYCIDRMQGRDERAATQARQLRRFPRIGQEAVEYYLRGKWTEAVLDPIPPKQLRVFLRQLLVELEEAGGR